MEICLLFICKSWTREDSDMLEVIFVCALYIFSDSAMNTCCVLGTDISSISYVCSGYELKISTEV